LRAAQQPMRLQATTRPCLMRRIGISKFRIDLGIRPSRRYPSRSFALDLSEPFFQLKLRRLNFCSQERSDFLMKLPKLFIGQDLRSILVIARPQALGVTRFKQITKKIEKPPEGGFPARYQNMLELRKSKRCGVLSAIGHEPYPNKAKDHHRPSGRLWDRGNSGRYAEAFRSEADRNTGNSVRCRATAAGERKCANVINVGIEIIKPVVLIGIEPHNQIIRLSST
jgi:hypothetical protein